MQGTVPHLKPVDAMTMTFFEYLKMILQKVSFDAKLFEKELKKGIQQLMPEEIKQLKAWCYEQFGKLYRRILKRCFATVNFRRLRTVPV